VHRIRNERIREFPAEASRGLINRALGLIMVR
jgi:hypothetical protein